MQLKLLFLIFLLIATVYPATYYVDPITGNDVTCMADIIILPCQSISQAYNLSASGDRIFLFPGNYTEAGAGGSTSSLQIAKRLNITGNTSNPSDTNVTLRGGAITVIFDFLAGSSGSSLQNIQINATGLADTAVRGVLVRAGTSNMTFHNVRVVSAFDGASNSCIEFEDSATNPQINITIQHTNLSYCDNANLDLGSGNTINVTIKDSYLDVGWFGGSPFGILTASAGAVGKGNGLLIQGVNFTSNNVPVTTFGTAIFFPTMTYANATKNVLIKDINVGTCAVPSRLIALRTTNLVNLTLRNASIYTNYAGGTGRQVLFFENQNDLITIENSTFGGPNCYMHNVNSNIVQAENANQTIVNNSYFYINSSQDVVLLSAESSNLTGLRITNTTIIILNNTNIAHVAGIGLEAGDPDFPDVHNSTIADVAIYAPNIVQGNTHSVFLGGTFNATVYNIYVDNGQYGVLCKDSVNALFYNITVNNTFLTNFYDKSCIGSVWENSTSRTNGTYHTFIDGSSPTEQTNRSRFYNINYNITQNSTNTTFFRLGQFQENISSNFNNFTYADCSYQVFSNPSNRFDFPSWQSLTLLELNSTFNCAASLNVSIQVPINGSNFSINSVPFNFTLAGRATTCFYSLDNGANVTIPLCANTTLTPGFGKHFINLFAYDVVAGLHSSGPVNFTVDVYAPKLTVQSPLNNSNFTGAVPIDFVVSENLTSVTCAYSLDQAANQSIANCLNTSISPAQGRHTIIIFANDTVGNLNSSQLNFTVDSTAPFLNLSAPVNGTVYDTLPVNFTVSDPLVGIDKCFYSINSTANVTVGGCLNITVGLLPGNYTFQFFVNDTLGNLNSSNIRNFTINTSVNITYINPINGSSIYSKSNITLDLDVTSNAASIECTVLTNFTSITFTANVSNSSFLFVLTPPISGVYNITTSCGGESEQITVGYLLLRRYNVSFSPGDYSYNSLVTYVQGFYTDYLDYILAIFTYGIAYMFTNKYQDTIIAGGVGCFAVFFITGNPVLLAGGILSVLVGYILKYAGG